MLGQGRPMNRKALEMTPPRRVSRVVSPSTYFGASQRGYAVAAANVELVQAPQPDLPQHYVPPPHIAPAPQYGCVPDTRQRKLGIRPFDGKELYQGLGSGFQSWGKHSVRQISFAERASDFQWSEDVKVDVLEHHLTGMAERYYNRQVEGWWEEEPTLEHAMQRLLHTFATKITPARSMKLLTAPKSPMRSGTGHYLYLVAASEACGGADNLVQDNIVPYADLKLAHFVQSTEIELRGKNFGRDSANNVHEWCRDIREERKDVREERRGFRSERRDARKCYKCEKPGHLKAAYPERNREGGTSGEVDFALTVDGSSVDKEYGILDSDSSRHLVNDDKLLEDPEEYLSYCVAADGGHLRITKCEENLERNIISYGLRESKGFGLSYRGKYRVVAGINDGSAVFDVELSNNVLIVLAQVLTQVLKTGDVLMSVLAKNEAEICQDVQKGSHMHSTEDLRP
uniref:Uncharacterized protein AlNc14C185G8316 n=1 Tax=Albugo laibachii Nc14 TaxID=890382 RepID=F0WPH1_9STRA|nr:conserved hypothetical protein [Albugo laibachii Nc14]|eukprot:CCA23219.1 conserved hypothetical protein [Albugo laibachii Nc14]